MRHIHKQVLVSLFVIICISISLEAQTNSPYKTQLDEIQKQGDVALGIAKERCTDKKYSICADALHSFLFLYPSHPKTREAMDLLSFAYKKQHLWIDAAEVELTLYRKDPTSESGLQSYLNAARLMIRVGDIERGKQILDTIKSQSYSVKLSQDADTELQQIEILGEKG